MENPPLPSRFTSTSAIGVVRVPGLVPFGVGLEWQRALARARMEGRLDRDLLLLLEHEPVLTVGRGADAEDPAEAAGVDLPVGDLPRVEVERGGDVTYHGPGQLVGYPILDLARFRPDLHWYVRRIEEALILALETLEVPAFRVARYTGVWVGDPRGLEGAGTPTEPRRAPVSTRIGRGELRKIASIGVHVSRWVTWHGFALNVREAALGPFAAIVPCGIPGVSMTSLESERSSPSWEEVVSAVADGFGTAFGVPMAAVELGELETAGLGPRPISPGRPSNVG